MVIPLRRLAFCIGVTFLVFSARELGATQAETVHISDTVRCGSCVVIFEQRFEVTPPAGVSILDTEVAVRSESGGIYLHTHVHPDSIFRYDSLGRFERALSYGWAAPATTHLSSRADSLWVFRLDSLLVQVGDGPLMAVAALGWPILDAVRGSAGGGWFLNASVRTPKSIGLPIHHFETQRGWLGSFGTDRRVFRSDIVFLMSRSVALSEKGTLLTSPRTAYLVEEWDEHGARERAYVRNATAFEPWFQGALIDQVQGPRPMLVDLSIDAAGRLWTLSLVGDEDWGENVKFETDGEIVEGIPVLHERAYDSLVEVLDLEAGVVLARARSDHVFRRFLSPGWLLSYAGGDDGNGALGVHSVTLSGSPAR